MIRFTSILSALLLLFFTTGCDPKTEGSSAVTAFTGATLIDGTGTAAITNAVMLIEGGKIREVGSSGTINIPEGATRINLTGKYIMPGMINSHGHIGGTEGLQGGQYAAANVIRDLHLNARYGVTTIVSLGGDGAPSIDIRNSQNTDSLRHSRLFVAGTIVTGDSPEAARKAVRENAQNQVDFIKIRVDDNLGASVKMPADVYSAVIDEAHKNNIPVASHLYYLEDAKGLLNAGTDYIAHSIRDQAVDQELIDLMKEKDVYYCPTLMREVSVFVYADTADFFEDEFLTREVNQDVIRTLNDPERQKRIAENPRTQIYREALNMALQNLKTLSDNGVKIVMGTDAGPPARFMGYFEHKELELMAKAGLSPMEIIMAATGNAAAYLGLDKIGSLQKGNWADFIVIKENPREDISHTQSLEQVWIAGNRIALKNER